MDPKRKKSKPNVESRASDDRHSPDNTSQSTPKATAPASAISSTTRQPTSWYSPNSWKQKASPVAQIACESISVAKGATSESSEEKLRRPSQSIRKSMRGSRKSIPVVAEPTMIHAISDAADKSRSRFPSEEKLSGFAGGGDGASEEAAKSSALAVEEPPLPPEPKARSEDANSVDTTVAARPQSGAWFGWWSRPDGYGSDGERSKTHSGKLVPELDEANRTPLPEPPDLTAVADGDKVKDQNAPKPPASVQSGPATTAQWEGLQTEMSANQTTSRSWFGLWSSAQNQQAQTSTAKQKGPQAPPVVVLPTEPAATANSLEEATPLKKTNPNPEVDEQRKSSGWAFWSSDKPKADTAQSIPSGAQKQVGELAVADTPSQSHPEVAQFNEQRQPQDKLSKQEPKRVGSLLKPKRGQSEKTAESEEGESSKAFTSVEPVPPTPPVPEVQNSADPPPRGDSSASTPVQQGKQAQMKPNLILPSFRDTYASPPNVGYMERFTHYVAHTLRLPGSLPIRSQRHVYISIARPKIRRAIAIGVHGFFPAPLIQRVLGQPTGTSIRFANYAAASIKTWCTEHQPDVKDVEVEKVALEGEGHIADRVNTLWKLMLNWLSHLRQADFILMACHSQGVPVAFMLIAKLIQLGALSPNVKIGVCAMAGINLGPFPEYKSRLFGSSALELFDFCNSDSRVSCEYAESMDVCLRHGVRVTFVGSIDDQLVSLESSLHAPLSHPYVHRAVFIDGRVHVPNFLTHLVVFALKLRNLGVSDHGLIRELSAPLAGSLVGGDGHSRVYDDPAVYRLAVDFALESTDVERSPAGAEPPATAASTLLATDKALERDLASARRASLSGYPASRAIANGIRRGSLSAATTLPGIAPEIAHYDAPQSGAAANPFYLPWAVRGMLEEEVAKRDEGMRLEVEELVKEFAKWKPTSKVLKDVRWRLEGVKSMLS